MTLSLFQGFGIELEYMIVDRETLSVRPITDLLLRDAAQSTEWVSDHESGAAAWSNELVLHVIEYKTNGPAPALAPLPDLFAAQVQETLRLLAPHHARLMPTAMHPWYDPATETRLWPHDYSPVYETYNRIFGCTGHGWSNLQSMHINLPFANDAEFARLHAAIRLALPILPALAASSPVVERRVTGIASNRLEMYRFNSRRIPSITGAVIPEPVWSRGEYEDLILSRCYRDVAPLDPDGIIQHEFLNSRGAIARFDRMAIEIRVLDVQECPLADIAVASLVTGLVRGLCDEKWSSLADQKDWDTAWLAHIFNACVQDGGAAVINDREYLTALGWTHAHAATAQDLWRDIWSRISFESDQLSRAARVIVGTGSLSSRLVRALGPSPTHAELKSVAAELCDCIESNALFRA